jgi:hypothetical protein
MSIWEVFLGCWGIIWLMFMIGLYIIPRESGSQRYKHGRDYPYDQDLDWDD